MAPKLSKAVVTDAFCRHFVTRTFRLQQANWRGDLTSGFVHLDYFDEIRFWADYISPGKSDYVYDDDGVHGGLTPGELFVIAGDENSDPLDGDSISGATQQLLDNPLVNSRVWP